MYRILSAFVLPGLLLFLIAAAPRLAAAGEYGYDGDDYRRPYTSSDVGYERVYREDYERPYYRPYGYQQYGGPSYVASGYDDPRRYYGGDYFSGYGDWCYRRRIRIFDGRGGWVWGMPASCY